MDIEFKYGQRKRRIVMVVGVVLAVVAFGGVLLTASAPPATAIVPTRQVLVATAEIKPRTVLDEGMFVVRTVPDDASLAQVYTDASAVVGRTTAVQIYAQQMITPNLITNSVAGAAFSILEPGEIITALTPEWRAVSVMVAKDRAVGGMLEVGQHVDLFTTVQWSLVLAPTPAPVEGASPSPAGGSDSGNVPGEDSTAGKATIVTWKDVQILAKAADGDIYVLKVSLHQGEEINHFQATDAGGTFGMALRADGDYRPIDIAQYGETNDRIVNEYHYPVPQFVDMNTYPQTSPVPGPWVPGASPSASPDAGSPAPSTSPSPSATPAP